MKQYTEYKDSGIAWIGEIPSGWETMKFSYLFSFSRGLGITKEDLRDTGIPCVSYGEIHSKYGFEVNPEIHNLKCVDESYLETSDKSLLSKGNFVFADTSEDIDGSGNFTHLTSDTPVFAGYHTIIARLADTNNYYRYLAYLFDCDGFRAQIRSKVYGIKVFSITQSILKSVKVILPTIEEQQAIADYLDRKTTAIDILVTDKQKLIDLLKERRQAIICETVTKGLDRNAKMKDSGIEWIGEIPQHWDIKKLRYLGSCQNGLSKAGEYFGRGYPFVSYGDVYKNYELPQAVEGLVESSEAERDTCSVKRGDVFFTRTSETIEEVALTSSCLTTIENATFAGFLIRFRPYSQNEISPEFSKYYFRSQMHRAYFVKEMNLVTRASLSQELLKNLPVVLPNRVEQRAIADYLDQKTSAIDSLITDITTQIEKLKEYRQSIISEAVTGKVAV